MNTLTHSWPLISPPFLSFSLQLTPTFPESTPLINTSSNRPPTPHSIPTNRLPGPARLSRTDSASSLSMSKESRWKARSREIKSEREKIRGTRLAHHKNDMLNYMFPVCICNDGLTKLRKHIQNSSKKFRCSYRRIHQTPTAKSSSATT